MMPPRQRTLAAASLLLLLVLPLALGQLYDYGPVNPYTTASFLDTAPNKRPSKIYEGFPMWYRDQWGRACEPCTDLLSDKCLSTYVSPLPVRAPWRQFSAAVDLKV
jgi:hypothetical protein